jgi:hypothetical protein
MHARQVEDKSLKIPEDFSRSVSALEHTIRYRTTAESKAIFEALQWVAFALRPLEQQELCEALGTNLAFNISSDTLHDSINKGQCGQRILHHCRQILNVDENGLVDFHDAGMRVFVLSPQFVQVTGLHMMDAHEMIATVCIRHLQCESVETIVKPWLSPGRWLRARELKCHLWSYSVTFWPNHYRIAQCSSRYLSATLNRVITDAVAARAEPECAAEPKSKIKMNTGLEICSRYDLYVLGQTYLEMGADIDGGAYSRASPLTLAVMNQSSRMKTILLASGANPNLTDEDGLPAVGCAYANGDIATINTLIRRSAQPKTAERLFSFREQRDGREDHTPSFVGPRNTPANADSLHPTAIPPSRMSTPAATTQGPLCRSPPITNTDLVHATSNANFETIEEATRNLEKLSLHNAQMRYSPDCGETQHVDQDNWVLISSELFKAVVT